LELVDDLEKRAQDAFVRYRAAAASTQSSAPPGEADPSDQPDMVDIATVTELTDRPGSTDRPRLGVVQTDTGLLRGDQRRHR
jgi:hypothetical protein